MSSGTLRGIWGMTFDGATSLLLLIMSWWWWGPPATTLQRWPLLNLLHVLLLCTVVSTVGTVAAVGAGIRFVSENHLLIDSGGLGDAITASGHGVWYVQLLTDCLFIHKSIGRATHSHGPQQSISRDVELVEERQTIQQPPKAQPLRRNGFDSWWKFETLVSL